VTAPEINIHTFPYRLRWTQELVDEVLTRYEVIKDALTDIVGPSGQRMYVDPSITAIQALHLALAGGTLDEDLALIESRLRPDRYNMFEHLREWRARGEFDDDDPPVTSEEIKARAEQLRKEMREQVDPDVLDALESTIADEFNTDIKKNRRRGKRVVKEGE
jgi:hypothetical protein